MCFIHKWITSEGHYNGNVRRACKKCGEKQQAYSPYGGVSTFDFRCIGEFKKPFTVEDIVDWANWRDKLALAKLVLGD
jgi:hypothetical protein